MSCDMWFGTKDYAQFIRTPQTGADVSPQAWGSSGTLLNGSGYAFNSFNSHKEYSFSWGASAAREAAQTMKSYFDGSFGRGKLHFVDPLTYSTNVLPARWADPSITADFEGPQLVPGVDPYTAPTSNFQWLRLPVRTAVFDLDSVQPVSTPNVNEENSVFVPIPDGMQLNVGAFYSGSPEAGVYVVNAIQGGSPGTNITKLQPLTPNDTNILPNVFTKAPGDIGVYIIFGKLDSVDALLNVTAIHARLSPIGVNPQGENYWLGGQGNEGVRFVQPPTYINHTGVNGGQVEFAATFKESIH